MSEVGSVLRKLRGKMSLREASKKIGISHTYLDTIEKGHDKRSGSPVNPSPETLRMIASAYNYPYEKLLNLAGYIDEVSDEQDIDPELQKFIDEVKVWYKDAPETKQEELNLMKEMFKHFKNK